ncbi:MAG: VCBS repeat-containing protein [Acidobacteriota bacterium]|nr:VCBS repeat-containing protein [Acidobacteriota bacterium]
MNTPDLGFNSEISRRWFLRGLGAGSILLRAAPLFGQSPGSSGEQPHVPLLQEFRYVPHYPERSPLADVLSLVEPGSDQYLTELYAQQLQRVLNGWSEALTGGGGWADHVQQALEPDLRGASLKPLAEQVLRASAGVRVSRHEFSHEQLPTQAEWLRTLAEWLPSGYPVTTAEFEIYGLQVESTVPLTLQIQVRYDLVLQHDAGREERVGSWQMQWRHAGEGAWRVSQWTAGTETRASLQGPGFIDVTEAVLGDAPSYRSQLLHGVDYWRTVMDGAFGIDIYSNNGIAVGDFDGDGRDDLYVCQPAGLPNRLYRNRGDGTFEDVTERAGVGVLDNTACALFADLDNRGRQDLLVVCGNGPLLFRNAGDGTFTLQKDAFTFAGAPAGTYTHAAIADYDGDGRLDIYFCRYMYYLGLDQYHYPVPYYDARNGPPNVLMHNEGNGRFVEKTEAAGLQLENNRYSFACAWGDSNGNGLMDLVIANDFGKSQLYQNHGDGTFRMVSRESRIEDVGAGMSACWADTNNDGRQDVYISSMWEAAGQRVSSQEIFHKGTPESTRVLYQRHAQGNALYRNLGGGIFENAGAAAQVKMGRWSWSADFWDFDHDGFADLYVTNGYISAAEREDLASFFWRQVVGNSPEDGTPSLAYERGWNAINELIRADRSWNSHERNVMFVNHQDGTFSEISGAVGLDFLEDSRSFALADIDGDGRLEVILKNRNAPQVRVLRNAMEELGEVLSVRLRGTRSNRDAIGASILVEAGELKQTKFVQAGTGFLAQHSKEIFFGLAQHTQATRVTVRWPSGTVQQWQHLAAGHRYELTEGAPEAVTVAYRPTQPRLQHAGPAPAAESLPVNAATWLLQPLAAPAFSLPDSAGRNVSLESLRGHPALLYLCSLQPAGALDALRRLDRQLATQKQLNALVVCCDEAPPPAIAGLRLPMLHATSQMAGIYNILYRYLFDRRRDLGLPTALLLDDTLRIVRVYQGHVDGVSVLEDARILATDRRTSLQRALPFPGQVLLSEFERNDFTYGVALFQHGYLDQAAASFEQVVKDKPDSAEGYYNLGTLNLRRGDDTLARQYLQKTLALRPEYPEAWNNLGMMAARAGNTSEAIRDFETSLQQRPNYPVALLNLGNLYRRTGDFARAASNLQQALALTPDDPEVNYSLGMLYAQQGDSAQAERYLQIALRIRPAYPEARNNLGILLLRAQRLAEAEEQFRKAIAQVPGYDQSYLNLARLQAMRGDKAGAVQVLQQLLARQPENRAAQTFLNALQP